MFKQKELIGPTMIGLKNLAYPGRDPEGIGFTNQTVCILAQELIDSYAEIDRLNDELTALRAQVPAEREWISSETHETFPAQGIYYAPEISDDFTECFVEAGPGRNVPPGFQYTLILAEKDFPVPPNPEPELEVKVGKYHWGTKGKTCHILDIGQKYCLYRFGGNSQAVLHQPIETMQRMMREANAVFIGEGDNQ